MSSSLWDLLDDSYRSVNRLLAQHLAQSGHPDVRASHGAVFENIHQGGSRITDMAERAGITKQSMGQFVDELEMSGYVERVPDPHDGRAKLVRLTGPGSSAVKAAFRALQDIERHATRSMGRDDMAKLHMLLSEFADALGSLEDGERSE